MIYYTLNDSTPTTNAQKYANPLTITSDVLLTAFAVAPEQRHSPVARGSYTLTKAATPDFTPSQGPLRTGATISIRCSTSNATIRYTLNGQDPDLSSPLFSTALVFNGPITLRARAFAPHFNASDIHLAFFGLLHERDTVVTTIAGSTTGGFANGFGTAARFSSPTGICADQSGNLYVADMGNNVVRKILRSGEVTILAGTGISGSAVGPATNAQFSGPTGVCMDQGGNLYVADGGNCNRICKISTNEIDCHQRLCSNNLAVCARKDLYRSRIQ